MYAGMNPTLTLIERRQNGVGLVDVVAELGVVVIYILILGGLAVYLYEMKVTP